ncbi:nuclear factor interleukin-3-regulated protein-like [Arapaima gigas]
MEACKKEYRGQQKKEECPPSCGLWQAHGTVGDQSLFSNYYGANLRHLRASRPPALGQEIIVLFTPWKPEKTKPECEFGHTKAITDRCDAVTAPPGGATVTRTSTLSGTPRQHEGAEMSENIQNLGKRRESLSSSSWLALSSGPRGSQGTGVSGPPLQQHEVISYRKKEESYWDKQRKNNEAAKRSRDRRRAHDAVLDRCVSVLLKENAGLRAELLALKFRFGLIEDAADQMGRATCEPLLHVPQYSLPHSDSAPSSLPPTHGGLNQGRRARDTGCISDDSGISTSGSPMLFDWLSEPDKLSPAGQEAPRYNPQPCPPGEPLAGGRGGTGAYSAARRGAGRQDSEEIVRHLPHKLRFKAACGNGRGSKAREPAWGNSSLDYTGADDTLIDPARIHFPSCGTEVICPQQPLADSSPEEWRWPHPCGLCCQHLPVLVVTPQHLENSTVRHQLSSLNEEVAQLKWLFSQQRFSKAD